MPGNPMAATAFGNFYDFLKAMFWNVKKNLKKHKASRMGALCRKCKKELQEMLMWTTLHKVLEN